MAIKPYMGLMGSGMFIEVVSSALVPASQQSPHIDTNIDSAKPDPMNRGREDVKKRDEALVVPHGDLGRGPLFG